MSSQGPSGSGTIVDDSSKGTVAWSNPGNAAVSDGVFATAIVTLSQITHFLNFQNFGFTIPPDAIITGVLVEIQRDSLAGTCNDDTVKLVYYNVVSGSNKALGTAWPTSEAYQSYGGSTDVWNLVLKPADINDATFGCAIAVTGTLGEHAQIDYARITVYYDGSNRMQSQAGNRRVNAGGMGQPDWVS